MLDFSKYKDRRIKCAGIGEVLFDVYPSGPKIGGAPANFTYNCIKNGLMGIVLSCVGNDDLGFEARNLLAKNFIPALLLNSSKSTGTVNVSLKDFCVPSYSFASDTAYDNIPCDSVLLETAKELDMICFGTLAQRSEVSHNTILTVLDSLKEDALRVFDVNLRGSFYTAKIIEESLKRSDIVKCNEDELGVLCQLAGMTAVDAREYYEYLKSRGIFCFVFTEGAYQSSVFLNDKSSVLKTPEVDAIDTVGAGDSFTATLVSSLMQGQPLSIAHKKAVKVSAYVCTKSGAMPDIPDEIFSV